FVTAIGVRDLGRDATAVLNETPERGVVFDVAAEPRSGEVADEPFGFALIVRQDAVVPGVNRGVVETWAHLGPLAVAKKVHHVPATPQVALEQAFAQRRVHQIHHLDRAGVERDGARLAAGTGHPIDAAIFDAAPRQLHREHTADGTPAD